jgi:plasmid stabilization system protein ParE
VRKLASPPYINFYRAKPEEGRVEILRYWHGARGAPELGE